MPYPIVKLGQIAKVKGGKRLPLGDELVSEKTAHPYVRARDIRDGKVTFSDPVYVTDDIFQKIKNYTVKANDVCITIVGANVGDVGLIPPFLNGANLTENAVKLTELQNCDPFFLNYCLLGSEPQGQMKQYAAGAAQSKLGIYKVNEIDIPFPPLETQRKIASILSTYDDLIENNTRRIKILEEMARMIYREWFVNFRFPGHEQVKMVDSPLGMIPEGWEVKTVQDYIELCYGKALKAEDRKDGPYPVYGSSGVVGFHSESLVGSPGIIVGRKGNVGSVHWTDRPFFPIDTVYYVKTDVSLYYVFYNLQQQNFINNDAAVPGLNRNQAYSLPFILPTKSQLKAFDEFIGPVFKAVRSLTKKNQNLCQTRDLLLPKLISGEVAV